MDPPISAISGQNATAADQLANAQKEQSFRQAMAGDATTTTFLPYVDAPGGGVDAATKTTAVITSQPEPSGFGTMANGCATVTESPQNPCDQPCCCCCCDAGNELCHDCCQCFSQCNPQDCMECMACVFCCAGACADANCADCCNHC